MERPNLEASLQKHGRGHEAAIVYRTPALIPVQVTPAYIQLQRHPFQPKNRIRPSRRLLLFEQRLAPLEQRFETFKSLLASVDGKIKRN